MNYNIFIVSSPLQLMNAIEATNYFKTNNNILLLLYTDNTKVLNQMKKLLGFVDWHIIKYISIPQKIIDKLLFVNSIHNSLKDIIKEKIDKLFVGEYRSDHVTHIVNTLTNKNIYLLDDGLAQLDYHKEMNTKSHKVRKFVYKALFYKLQKINYTFFTIFDIQNEKIIKNNYSFFKKNISDKQIDNSIYFISQPLVELEIISEENHRKLLSKIINFYKRKKFIYIMHRREDIEHVKKLSNELNFEYKILENLIELEMINAKSVPLEFATFFSTAIVTLPNFIKISNYRVFQIDKSYLNKKYVDGIFDSYREFKRLGLKKELL